MRVILSYGMGVDSTALLLNWLENPESRRYRYQATKDGPFKTGGPFDLKDLVVMTAMTGDEFPDLTKLLEKHILPRLRKHKVRYVQVARKGPTAAERLKVLDDSPAPRKIFMDGWFKLSDELLGTMTVPNFTGTRKCSIKSKGEVLDTWLKKELGKRPFVQAVGFNAEEEWRIKRDQTVSFTKWPPGQRTSIYPLLYDWNWSRKACVDFIKQHTGVTWPKSACAFCPFAAGELVLPRFAKFPQLAADSLFMEYCAMSLNYRSTLYSGGTLRKLVERAGDREAIRRFKKKLNQYRWAVYQIQRIYVKTSGGHNRGARRVTIMQEGKRAAMERELRRYGPISLEGDIPRVITLPKEENIIPTLEELYVAAPRAMGNKTPKNYDFERNWKLGLQGRWDEVQKEILLKDDEGFDFDLIMSGADPMEDASDLGDFFDDDRIQQKLWIQEFAETIKTPYDPYGYEIPGGEQATPESVTLGVAAPETSVWHTDIVVAKQGFNVKLEPQRGRWRVSLTPDTPGPEAERAMERFSRAMGYADDLPEVNMAKMAVEQAVASTGARWNGWHREAY